MLQGTVGVVWKVRTPFALLSQRFNSPMGAVNLYDEALRYSSMPSAGMKFSAIGAMRATSGLFAMTSRTQTPPASGGMEERGIFAWTSTEADAGTETCSRIGFRR